MFVLIFSTGSFSKNLQKKTTKNSYTLLVHLFLPLSFVIISLFCCISMKFFKKSITSFGLSFRFRLHIPFANKGIDAINISNILNRKEVVKEIPPYFINQSVPIVSYSYTNRIGRKMFNYVLY